MATTASTNKITMVLAELGGKLRESLRKLQLKSSVGNDEINALLSDVARALIEADVNVQLVMKLRDNIRRKVQSILTTDESSQPDIAEDATAASNSTSRAAKNRAKIVQKAVVEELVALLKPNESTASKSALTLRRGKSHVVLFVGLQGAGKTTTIAKFAHYYSNKRHHKTGMVCADTFRAGALDQLKQNATKLRIPFFGSHAEADPVAIAQEGVGHFRHQQYELILVDSSGRHRQEAKLLEEMQELSAAIQPDTIVLVVDATQGQAVYDQALAFHGAVSVGAIIVTKLDGHAKGGGALSAVAATSSPILFLGQGEHFDDLEPFHAQSFVSKLLGYGDPKGLAEAMKGVSDKELMEKMSKGEFTLRDMYNQFDKVLNLGPLNRLMGMMPGMPDYLIPKSGDQEATQRLRKFMIMMDSMSNRELDGVVDLQKKFDPKTDARIRQIAAGSGSHVNEVKMLLATHKQMGDMVSQMGKSGMIGKAGQAKQQQALAMMKKNPNLIQQRVNQMDPKQLQQMGGREAVVAMLQQMAKGGGAPGGVPNMDAMMNGMPPGGMPGMPGLPGGMNMEQMMQMARSMGMGGPGPR